MLPRMTFSSNSLEMTTISHTNLSINDYVNNTITMFIIYILHRCRSLAMMVNDVLWKYGMVVEGHIQVKQLCNTYFILLQPVIHIIPFALCYEKLKLSIINTRNKIDDKQQKIKHKLYYSIVTIINGQLLCVCS